MSEELELPDWARNMDNPPEIMKYCGPEDQAVAWFASTTRNRYSIWCNGQLLDLDQQQASAVADMLQTEIDGAPAREGE